MVSFSNPTPILILFLAVVAAEGRRLVGGWTGRVSTDAPSAGTLCLLLRQMTAQPIEPATRATLGVQPGL
jgi:hypothetical protein